jgi:hypothetical protein
MSIKASAYDQGKFFKAADLPAEKKLKIKNVTEEVVGEAREKKLVVWFANDQRGLVLNRVNNRTLRTAFGDECDNWAGRTVALYPTTDNFRGQPVGVVRVRTAPAVQTAKTVSVDADGEVVDF